jgi:UDPglucose--hexose-1-phosphate uridylyltransferase
VTQAQAAVTVTSDRLSDGREIFYFDESAPPRRPQDGRALPAVAGDPTIRYDRLLGEWVTIAGHRQGRTHLPPDHECPLCPSVDGRATEVPAPDYDVVVFENRFPSFAGAGELEETSDGAYEDFPQRPARGRCEVVCFTSDHGASVAELSPARMRTILEAWISRTKALSRLPDVEQVFCFENRGEEIGVTLSHPHGQIYGYPFVTPRTERVLAQARRHRDRTGRSLFGEILAEELEDGARVVVRGEHWTAFVPFAARWPVEIHLYPHRPIPDLPDLDESERTEFAAVYLEILRRIQSAFGADVPYISAWQQAPVRRDRDLSHLHLELFSIRRAPGKLKYLAGSESGMGAFVNDRMPEETARTLREARV